MAIVTYEDLPRIREKYQNRKVVFASGMFDLTHPGHVLFFEECKKRGDILVVSVANDKIAKTKSPERPILNEAMRLKMVDSLRPVDYCLLERIVDSHSLGHVELTLKMLRPDVYVVNDDQGNLSYREETSRKNNVKLIVLPRTCPEEFMNISTTAIINKIKATI